MAIAFDWLRALNHGATPVELRLDAPSVDAITEAGSDGTARIEAMDPVILQSSR